MADKNQKKQFLWIAALVLFFFGLVGGSYLYHSSFLDTEDQMKISDYVNAVLALAVAMTGCIAAYLAYKSLDLSRKAEESRQKAEEGRQLAEEGQLYLKMMERYASREMADAMRLLGKFRDDNKANLKHGIEEWKKRRDLGDTDAKNLELARHRVKYFYRDLMQLYQAGYFSKKLTKRLLNAGGRKLFKGVILDMDGVINPLQFKTEFDPFDELYDELEVEQELTKP